MFMAQPRMGRSFLGPGRLCSRPSPSQRLCLQPQLQQWRSLVDSAENTTSSAESTDIQPKNKPDFGFAFDIDGVLLRGSTPLPRAAGTLRYLKKHKIPHIFLTNGGGYHEGRKASFLSRTLHAGFYAKAIVQSHTPFKDMDEFKDKNVLVIGGVGNDCRGVAKGYGFNKVILPGDIRKVYPEIWPLSEVFHKYYDAFNHDRSLSLPQNGGPNDPKGVKIDAIFVYHDPRDWGLDATLIIDCLLSKDGVLGTLSPKNGNKDLPNKGYQQDGQPKLFFSNPDLWYAGKYTLPRLGQGGFKAALQGMWAAITGGGVELQCTTIGKPHQATYEYTEKLMVEFNGGVPLKKVYMIGDNPESDIRGANDYKSSHDSKWQSILLRTGVYSGGEPSVQPTVIQDGVFEAVEWALKDAGWEEPFAEVMNEKLKKVAQPGSGKDAEQTQGASHEGATITTEASPLEKAADFSTPSISQPNELSASSGDSSSSVEINHTGASSTSEVPESEEKSQSKV